MFALSGCGVIETSNGDRAGTVTKLSHKGIFPFCRTWEGELLMGGLSGSASANANVFIFSVVDEQIVTALQTAMGSSSPVKLTYEQVMMPWICSMDTAYKIVAVQ